MNEPELDLGPIQIRIFDPTTREARVLGVLAEQPMTETERVSVHAERESAMDVWCYRMNIRIKGKSRADDIWRSVFGSEPPK